MVEELLAGRGIIVSHFRTPWVRWGSGIAPDTCNPNCRGGSHCATSISVTDQPQRTGQDRTGADEV